MQTTTRTTSNGNLVISIPIILKHSNNRKEIIIPQGITLEAKGNPVSNVTAQAISKAFTWQKWIESGKFESIDALAKAAKVDESYVRKLLNLCFISPVIIRAILEGAETSETSVTALKEMKHTIWQSQEEYLGYNDNA